MNINAVGLLFLKIIQKYMPGLVKSLRLELKPRQTLTQTPEQKTVASQLTGVSLIFTKPTLTES